MIYHYSMVIKWSDEDNCYLVHLPDFPFQKFHVNGDTYEEAAKHGQEVLDTWIEVYQQDGRPLPKPKTLDKALNVA